MTGLRTTHVPKSLAHFFPEGDPTMSDVSVVIPEETIPVSTDEAQDEAQDEQPAQIRLIDVDPDEPFPIPTIGQAFQRAPDLQALADDLLKRDHQVIDDVNWTIKGCSIRYAWKQHGGTSQGGAVLGKCVKLAGVSKFFGRADFLIWCAADHLADMAPTYEQMRALLLHELLHIEKRVSEDDEITYHVRRHDIEAFVGEIEVFGLWRDDLEQVAETFQQLGLAVD